MPVFTFFPQNVCSQSIAALRHCIQ